MQPLFFDLDDTILVYHGVSEQAWTEACDIYIDHFSNLSSSQLLNVILAASSWFWSDEKRFKKMMHNLVLKGFVSHMRIHKIHRYPEAPIDKKKIPAMGWLIQQTMIGVVFAAKAVRMRPRIELQRLKIRCIRPA